MKTLICLALIGALSVMPISTARSQSDNTQNASLLQCTGVLIVVGTGIYIWIKVIRPMCLRIQSNQNWLLTNGITDWGMLRSGSSGPGTSTLQYSTGLGRVWANDLAFDVQQNGSTVTVVASRNGTAIATNSASLLNTNLAVVRFDNIKPPTNAPCVFYRLAE